MKPIRVGLKLSEQMVVFTSTCSLLVVVNSPSTSWPNLIHLGNRLSIQKNVSSDDGSSLPASRANRNKTAWWNRVLYVESNNLVFSKAVAADNEAVKS